MKYKVFQRYSDVAALNIASYFSKVSIWFLSEGA